MRARLAIVVVLTVPLACKAPRAAAPERPAQSGVDESVMDAQASPCDDFYRYACGGWLDRTQIPEDRPAWGRLAEMDEKNRLLQRALLDGLTDGTIQDAPFGPQLAGYWTACMDEARVEATGRDHLREALAALPEVKDAATLAQAVGALHRSGTFPAFTLDAVQDLADATRMIGEVDRGGMGLPDRDYYTSDQPKMKAIRDEYVPHVARMLELSGLAAAEAQAGAAAVMRLETALAQAALDRTARRDPKNVYHRLDLAGLERAAPAFPWKDYLAATGHADLRELNVTEPKFFERLDALVRETPPADWRVYLRWHLVRAAAPALPAAFVEEDFRFSRVLTGTAKLLPRWQRCAQSTERAVGFALGRLFVERTFGREGKEQATALVHGIERAMGETLRAVAWMDEPTRAAALEKLERLGNKIGYPAKWRDYSALRVDGGSYLNSLIAARAFEVDRRLSKIGKPVDRDEWHMTPQMVNAYYDPSMNEMVFPAGILQPPMFALGTPAGSHGAIGMVMGHELTHGFDDEGRKFDASGNLREWWTERSAAEFDRRAQCVKAQYDGYVAVDDLRLNGALTLGENIADLGGIKLAWQAFQQARMPPTGRFTPAQSFFLGYAQGWCTKRRPEYARMLVTVDPHSPPEHRVNGPLSNFPPFAQAFSCGEGSRMVRPAADRCEVW